MMRSMFSGVSGLRVHQTKMDVIANNIANVNTTGYKSSRVTFSEVFNQTLSGASAANADTNRGGVNPMQIGLGSSVSSIDKIMTTGASQRTDRPFDVMIEGDGFFIVSDAAGTYFTRAGALNRDGAGNLVNADGLLVMGWDAYQQDNGEWAISRGNVQPIKVGGGDKEYVVPTPTSSITIEGNLNETRDNGVKFGTMEFYDSIGNLYKVDVKYEYVTEAMVASAEGVANSDVAGTWRYSINDTAYLSTDTKKANGIPFNIATTAGTATITFGTNATPGFKKVGSIKFDSNGEIESVATGIAANPAPADPKSTALQLTIANPTSLAQLSPLATFGRPIAAPGGAAAGATYGAINLNFSGIHQFGQDPSDASASMDNGNKAGSLTDLSIGTNGIIIGRYTNGEQRWLGQIAVATFSNPAGLEKVGNNLFTATANSGGFDGTGEEVTASGGLIRGGVLEMSNVDLSSEFTEMITTQRGFQSNSRVITTSDDMLQELVNLKR